HGRLRRPGRAPRSYPGPPAATWALGARCTDGAGLAGRPLPVRLPVRLPGPRGRHLPTLRPARVTINDVTAACGQRIRLADSELGLNGGDDLSIKGSARKSFIRFRRWTALVSAVVAAASLSVALAGPAAA